MHSVNLSFSAPLGSEVRLALLIRFEMETLGLTKERYDYKFPKHKRDISDGELFAIARNKVVESLCLPLSYQEDFLKPPATHSVH